ncbi:hypothetical protein ACFLTE_10800, partial [Bacteroidota bacterium]
MSINMFGQNGPGGIGTIDGSSHLKLWLRSDQNVQYNELDTITSWTDYSGNSITFDSTVGPTFYRDYANGFPAVHFRQAIEGMHVTNVDMTDLFSAEENSIIIVKYSNSGTGTRTFFNWEETAATNLVRIDILNSGALDLFYPNTEHLTTSGPAITGSLKIFSSIIDIPFTTDPDIEHFVDGTSNSSMNTHSSTDLSEGTADLYLGTPDGTATNGWTGYLTDLIIFDTIINTAQRTIIENSLSAKYNITLTGTDYYDGDAASRDDFDFDVVGIGQESDGTQDSSNSEGFIISIFGANWDDGDYVFAGHSDLANEATTDDCANLGGNSERWARSWYVDRLYADDMDLKICFDFSQGINGAPPATVTDYRLIYRATNSGDFSEVTTASQGLENADHIYFTVADANLDSGYYTIGTVDKDDSPVTGGNTWFSYVDGDWDNWECWTLDPDGSLLINPTESSPGGSDTVYILNGSTITAAFDDISTAYLELRSGASLDVGTTTGHNFNSINGPGQIWIASNNFPDGDTTDFITQGTVKYYGTGTYNISTQPAYYNLEIEMDVATDTIAMLDSLTINNDLTITQGIFQINDNASTTILTLTVTGDIDVQNNGQLLVGQGNTIGTYNINGTASNLPGPAVDELYHNIYHQIYAYGDISNTGKIKLTNQNAPDYDDLTTTGGVSLYMKNPSDNIFEIYDSTFLYNLIIDKGTDQTYVLTIDCSDSTFFRLYGANSVARYDEDFVPPFDEADFELRKALWIYHGTLRLTGNIYIPSLTEGEDYDSDDDDPPYDGNNPYGDYCIGASGALWLDGDNVRVYSTAMTGDEVWGADGVDLGTGTQGISVTGRFKMSAGYFSAKNSWSFFYFPGYAGELILEGGIIDVSHFRRSSRGVGRFTYIQTGGTMLVRGSKFYTSGNSNTYAMFGLSETESVFQMSGGEIVIYDNNTYASDFYIISDEGNYSVTGGKVTISLDGGETFDISSTANLWNLDIINYNATGTFEINLDADLRISNDLLVDDNTIFDIDDGAYTLSIGGDLTLGSTTSSDADIATNAAATTIEFIGPQNSTINLLNNTDDGFFDPYNLTINKDNSSNTVTLESIGRADNDIAVYVYNDIIVNKGIFDYDNLNVEVRGDISNSGTLGVENSTGVLVIANGPARTITTSISGNPTYGHIELNDADGATLANNNAWFDQLTLTTGVLDIGDYRLTVDTNQIFTSGTFDDGLMIKLSGDHVAKGLKLKVVGSYTDASIITFPIGTEEGATDFYSNLDIDVDAATTLTGYINVRCVSDEHPAADDAPPPNTLQYYWDVDLSDDFTTTADNCDYDFYSDITYSGGGDTRLVYKTSDTWNFVGTAASMPTGP